METENYSTKNLQTDNTKNSFLNFLYSIKDFQLSITLVPVLLTAIVYYLGFLYVQGSLSAFTLNYLPWQIKFNGIITISSQTNFTAGIIYFVKLLLCFMVALIIHPVIMPLLKFIMATTFDIIEKLSLSIGNFFIFPIFFIIKNIGKLVRKIIPRRILAYLNLLFSSIISSIKSTLKINNELKVKLTSNLKDMFNNISVFFYNEWIMHIFLPVLCNFIIYILILFMYLINIQNLRFIHILMNIIILSFYVDTWSNTYQKFTEVNKSRDNYKLIILIVIASFLGLTISTYFNGSLNFALDIYDYTNQRKGLKIATVSLLENEKRKFLQIDFSDTSFIGYDLDNDLFMQIPTSQLKEVEIQFEKNIDNTKTNTNSNSNHSKN